jgi:hypothetical protein
LKKTACNSITPANWKQSFPNEPRNKRAKPKAGEQHATQLKLGFEQKLAEMEMTALRAQMNPHFIFNCLNSIKLYTTDNEAAKASAYLTKFSRLDTAGAGKLPFRKGYT